MHKPETLKKNDKIAIVSPAGAINPDFISSASNLMKNYGVLLTPGSCFELEKCARIGYACSTEILEQGLEKLSEYLKTL